MKATEIVLVSMLGLFTLALGYVLIFVLYQRKMISKDLLRQRMENDYQKKLLHSAIEHQEAERKRIAHDLHDEIGALLTTSRLYVNQLNQERTEEQLKIVSDKIDLLFNEMMSNIRRISHDLRPVVLENVGLTEALESVRDSVLAAGIDFNFTPTRFKASRDSELLLYRIIQELVTNTLKHARATRIDLSIEVQAGYLHIIYADNGVGFAPPYNADGLGLTSIESRVNRLAGKMQKINTDQGVCFLITINMNKPVNV